MRPQPTRADGNAKNKNAAQAKNLRDNLFLKFYICDKDDNTNLDHANFITAIQASPFKTAYDAYKIPNPEMNKVHRGQVQKQWLLIFRRIN